MGVFRWKGMLADGSMKSGKDEAVDLEHLERFLLDQQIALLKATPCHHQGLLGVWTVRSLSEDLVRQFFDELGLLLESGVDLVEALEACRHQVHHDRLNRIIDGLINGLEHGVPFHEAMRVYEYDFSPFVVSYIAAGEMSGALALMCRALASYLERVQKVRQSIRTAMVGPLVTLISASVIIIGIIFIVLPQLESMIQAQGAVVPWSTQLLLALSHLFDEPHVVWYVVGAMGIVLVAGGLMRVYYARSGYYLLRWIPWIGALYQYKKSVDMLYRLNLFIERGIPLMQALTLLAGVERDEYMVHVMNEMMRDLEHGLPLDQSCARWPEVFPSTVRSLIYVGTRSGRLADVLKSAEQALHKELQHRVARMVLFINPCMTIVVGLIIFCLIVSIYMPIFSIVSLPRW